MKRVRVEYPFHLSDTGADLVPGDEIEVNEDALTRIRAISVNLVSVLGDVTEEKPKTKAKSKANPKAKS